MPRICWEFKWNRKKLQASSYKLQVGMPSGRKVLNLIGLYAEKYSLSSSRPLCFEFSLLIFDLSTARHLASGMNTMCHPGLKNLH
jgi:hypothetical protein